MTSSGAASVSVSEAHEVDLDLVAAFGRLIPQLSSSASAPDADELAGIIGSEAGHVLVARDDAGLIVGTLTLVVFRIPTGLRAIIEDVVVDGPAVRGRGLRTGECLTRAALDLARSLDCKTVDLTSRPSREDANRLYQRLGFELRETNVYRFALEATDPRT
ncbi:MAG TPA: GNAT family N-acetyltransferase [Acidimicrobiales bacterium]|nr:GNAT family N-acetyltransferase [Acidimicrobiales bacterium]